MNKQHTGIQILFGFSLLISFLALIVSGLSKEVKFIFNDILSISGILLTSIALVVGVYFVILAIDAYAHVKEIRDKEEEIENRFNTLFQEKENSINALIQGLKNQSTQSQLLLSTLQEKENNINDLLQKLIDQSTQSQSLLSSLQEKEINANTLTQGLITQSTLSQSLLSSLQEKENQISRLTENWNVKYEITDNFLKYFTLSIYEEMNEKLIIADWCIENGVHGVDNRNELWLRRAQLAYRFPMLDEVIREKSLIELAALGSVEDIPPLHSIIENSEESDRIKDIAQIAINDIEERRSI